MPIASRLIKGQIRKITKKTCPLKIFEVIKPDVLDGFEIIAIIKVIEGAPPTVGKQINWYLQDFLEKSEIIVQNMNEVYANGF